jgi:hypothetical protein
MDTQGLLEQYSTKTDEELFRLAVSREELTEEACVALDRVMQERGLDKSERLEYVRQEEEERKQQLARNPGPLFRVRGGLIGRDRFGKANYSLDSATRMETFDTTVFILFFWLPLIPTASYRVTRRKEFLSDEFSVIERLPLQWEQVLTVWIVASSIVLALIWVWRLLLQKWLFS